MAAAGAGATTIDFEANPPADGATITKQYNNVNPPYGGVEFVSGTDKSQTTFETPTVQNVGSAATRSRVLQFTGSDNGEPGEPSDLWMTFDTARQTVSFYLEQATTISTDTSFFIATGYDRRRRSGRPHHDPDREHEGSQYVEPVHADRSRDGHGRLGQHAC